VGSTRDPGEGERNGDGTNAIPPSTGGALEAIERLAGRRSQIVLRGAPDDASPVPPPVSADGEDPFTGDARYEVLGEIGQGGMGTVYQGRDKDLGRDVALKVLRADLAEVDAVVQRFVEEAQVGGQLQHPGILPIYGLGLEKGGRPYFAMKLVKGETLASLMEGGKKGSDLIRVFERIAQTVAYAHSRGVIHRDLKPSNVMVGAFGEVHVVDWGFAKVLGREEPHDRTGRTIVATVRTGASGSHSVAGSIMGTPAYMPPEQAMGQVEGLTERSDVFSLGAILCEVLTRKPPYTGTVQDQIIAAMQARLDEAHARLDACNAPDALKQLARECLSPLPKDRPKDAGVVAQRVADHLASVEERARQAEIDAVHAAAEARRVQRGRRTTVMLAAVALVGIVGGAGGIYAWRAAERARAREAAAKVAPLLLEATRREGEANWPAAKAAAATALALANTEGADAETVDTVRALHARIDAQAGAAKAREEKLARETRLLQALDETRTQGTATSDKEVDAKFREAFAAFGMDPEGEDAAAALTGFSRPVELAVHLDRWARMRFRLGGEGWKVADRLARALDADPWRTGLRDAARAGDVPTLRKLAAEVDPAAQHPATLWWLGDSLLKAGDAEAAASLFRRSLLAHPSDYFLQHKLSQILWWNLRRASEAIPHAQAAVALRPDASSSWNNFGVIRSDGLKDHVGGIRALRRAVELSPGFAVFHSNLGHALREKGELDASIATCREAIRIDPKHAAGHHHLGLALQAKGDLDGAVASFREGVRLDTNFAQGHLSLGVALDAKGDTDGALAAYREAIRIDPNFADAHHNLALTLTDKGDFEGAVAEYREAVRLHPQAYWSWVNMSVLLCDRLGRYDEAIAACSEAIRIDPKIAQPHFNIYVALNNKGDLVAAVEPLRRAVALNPKNAGAQRLLARVERLVAALPRLPAVLAGRERPSNPEEWLLFAEVSYRTKDYVSSLRLHQEAFAADPRAETDSGVRYSAARAAALAGSPAHPHALTWLSAELDALERAPAADVVRALRHWKANPDLATVRDGDGLSDEWRALWVRVDALLARAGGAPK
jgi:serine/threonine-protein kinase